MLILLPMRHSLLGARRFSQRVTRGDASAIDTPTGVLTLRAHADVKTTDIYARDSGAAASSSAEVSAMTPREEIA